MKRLLARKMLNPFGVNANLASLARGYYWTAGVVMILAMLIALLEGVGVSLLIPLLSTLTNNSNSPSGGLFAIISRIAEGHSRNERLLIVSSLILFFVTMKTVCQITANIFAAWVDGHVGQAIRSALSERLHAVGYSFFIVQDPARLLNVLSTESWKASDAVRVLLTRIAASGNVLVFGILLLLVSWRLFFLVLLGGLLMRFVQTRTEARLRALSERTVVTNQALADRMLFAIFGARVIRLFNEQLPEHERFRSTSDEVRRAILRTEQVAGTQGPLLEAMHGYLFVFVLLVAIFTGSSLPVLAAFLVLMNRLQPHLRILEQSASGFASASGHFNEVEWLLDPRDKPVAPHGEQAFDGLTGDIVFDDVTFDYGMRGEPAVSGACFTLVKGRATALIGPSGAGKSTVINLLCRLLEPVSGTIKIGGQPLSCFKIADWLNRVAVAGQDIDLIDGTIAENIAYGRPDMSVAKIRDAAQAAHATFIDQLPQGLATLVGPRGLSLSGGQRQRIGIARALVREPDLLILDEATNAVDQETESGILDTLERKRKDMTIVVVSHRMTTLAVCDDAIVFQGGRVVKTGPLTPTLEFYAAAGADIDKGVDRSETFATPTSTER
jgi:subfamily B ATP-binding cassette protein MsbA